MPHIVNFIIENFKGIKRVEIDIEQRNVSPVITLIGLNESGKTTILEALSHFVSGDKSVASLFDGSYAAASGLKLIPLQHKAAFTGEVKISSKVQLDPSDISDAVEIAKSQNLILDEDTLKSPINISRRFFFEDSVLKNTTNNWDLTIKTKSPRAKQFTTYQRPNNKLEVPDLWLEIVTHFQKKLQQVCYFPTFLVDMPVRIYLEEHDKETPINRYYRFVFQEILDSVGGNLNLEKHVCNRIRDFKSEAGTSSWLSIFLGSPDKGPIDSVFQKISSAITKEVLGSWQRIFQRSISANSIAVEWHIDPLKDHIPYATFWVSDGESRYAINERSLGFRWFFSFLLFTSFKKSRERKTIFLFDEPAANLHAKAQAELLTSFSRIASGGNKIIYSTHSHHMINPVWLNAAYIIENAALDYDKTDSFDLNTKPTEVNATPYRQFVANFPSRTSYFQPVIEKLEYVPPEVIGKGPYVIVEGISDYYALALSKRYLQKEFNFSLMPGVGSGASGPLISQLIGQGLRFLILLDDDSEGRKAAQRYIDEWYLDDNVVITLKDLNSKYSGNALENILDETTIDIIKHSLNLTSKPTKKQIGWYLAEACANSEESNDYLSKETLSNFSIILDEIDNKINGTVN